MIFATVLKFGMSVEKQIASPEFYNIMKHSPNSSILRKIIQELGYYINFLGLKNVGSK
jgi:hypothetical protein